MASHSDCKNQDERFLFLMERQNNVCKFTGLPFEARGRKRPEGDHCHTTASFRGFVFADANSLLGRAEYLMDICGWTVDQLCDRIKEYLSDPGIDIGLQLYPSDLGYATEEEAIATHNLSTPQVD